MKKLMLIMTAFLCLSLDADDSLQVINLSHIEAQKKVLKQWVQEQGGEKIRHMEINKENNLKLEWIKTFYPHLLPQNFFNREVYMSCFSQWKNVESHKSEKSLDEWRSCQKMLWRESPYPFLKKVLEELKGDNGAG